MNTGRLEHLNLSARDPERTAELLASLFDWHIRWQGPAARGGRTVHVGNESAYLALYCRLPEGEDEGAVLRGMNHVGVEVDDLEATEARVRAAGLTPRDHGDYDPGRRCYFSDTDGIEFEVVSYA